MQELQIPYGRTTLPLPLKPGQCKAVLQPRPAQGEGDQQARVVQALEHPIGSPRLCELAREAHSVLVITSDHTRPVPSRITLPLLLAEVRRENPAVSVTILVATGAHRAPTRQELCEKLGEEVVAQEKILSHECFDLAQMVSLGVLPSGCELLVNRLALQADLVVAEGFIEPHFFAGFSGGRKSILPGIAYQGSIMANHCAEMIAHPHARTGVLKGNPIHADMVCAARLAKLRFILNVALDAQKRVTAAFAGDFIQAHEVGCAFVEEHTRVASVPADIVVTSNGGYPLDQNLYQAVKGMTAAESCVRPGGVIIEVAECIDGNGGEQFVRWLQKKPSPRELLDYMDSIPAQETIADQWQAQILARVLCRATVVMVSDAKNRADIEAMGMRYAGNLSDALTQAVALRPHNDGVVVIPDGVSIIVGELPRA